MTSKLGRTPVLSLCGVLITGCVVTPHVRVPARSHVRVHRPAPPPHAPAHGHRHRHHAGVELEFDGKLGVYVVVGHPHHYFHDGHYFRLVGGVWQVSVALDKGWSRAKSKRVPKGLLLKHAEGHEKHVPAKHRP